MHFSTVALFGRYQDSGMDEPLKQLANFLTTKGLNIIVDQNTADHTQLHAYSKGTLDEIGQNADLAIVLGGDGTMLGVGRQLASYNIPLVGINHGRLGFITDIPIHDANPALHAILDGHYVTESRSLLEGSIVREGQTLMQATALNDVVLNRAGRGGMIEIQVDYNDDLMYTQRADGLIVATPTGSTAYSLSANGPILHPQMEAFLLVPVAPQTLSTRAIVVPDTGTLKLTLTEISQRGKRADVHFDMQTWSDMQTGDQVVVKKAKGKITFIHPTGYSYFYTLRQKLHWNIMPQS